MSVVMVVVEVVLVLADGSGDCGGGGVAGRWQW